MTSLFFMILLAFTSIFASAQFDKDGDVIMTTPRPYFRLITLTFTNKSTLSFYDANIEIGIHKGKTSILQRTIPGDISSGPYSYSSSFQVEFPGLAEGDKVEVSKFTAKLTYRDGYNKGIQMESVFERELSENLFNGIKVVIDQDPTDFLIQEYHLGIYPFTISSSGELTPISE